MRSAQRIIMTPRDVARNDKGDSHLITGLCCLHKDIYGYAGSVSRSSTTP